MLTTCPIVALAVWLGLTIICQWDVNFTRIIRSADWFSLIPVWTFFAPNPGQSDYHLVYRDKKRDDSLTPWCEIPIIESRTWASALWNPRKREKKVLSDVVAFVARLSREHQDRPDFLVLSVPYLIVLNVVVHRQHETEAISTQFAITETFGFFPSASMRLIMYSEFHSLMQHNETGQLHPVGRAEFGNAALETTASTL